MKTKKKIYILLSMVLGLLLSMIAHALIEMWFLNVIISEGLLVRNYNFLSIQCFLHPLLQIGLLLAGLLGGYFLGQAWWRIVYIEHRHWRYKK